MDILKQIFTKKNHLLSNTSNHPSSIHPSHITSNIPYALGLRTLRICSERATFLKRIEEMRQDLLSCDYHPKILESAFKRILKVERSEALQKVEKTSEKDINSPFVITYHPKLPSITNITRKHWNVMSYNGRKNQRARRSRRARWPLHYLRRCGRRSPSVRSRKASHIFMPKHDCLVFS